MGKRMIAKRSALQLHLPRHGQTDCSRANRFCGSIDVPLNEDGAAMAEAYGSHYADQPWQAIYGSPVARARQTPERLAARVHLPIQIEPGLREIADGEWPGLRAEIGS
jgi:probable phosphoglycerate mutase